ncbi:MAG: RpiB/LacA/LacB family sugar-phosphate isomerase, partial [Candidatus Magasanikbacteria bacterium]|nr:RpiB/LacA/LacB family sugar-phosphate isomerase [Candidatus Magasanikbacteria bacterium]
MKGLKVAVGSDHAGYRLKKRICKYLNERSVAVIDVGPNEFNPDDDYPDFAHIVGQMVSQGEVDFGVLVCGTGKGMAITANKWIGVRAVTVKDLF